VPGLAHALTGEPSDPWPKAICQFGHRPWPHAAPKLYSAKCGTGWF
jgi:hypothetical protein